MIANGDEVRTRVFAERAYAARLIIEGEDSPQTEKMKQLVERPAQHARYNAYVALRAGSGAPPAGNTDGEEFENWLWKEGEGEEENEGLERSFDSMSSSSVREALFRSLGFSD